MANHATKHCVPIRTDNLRGTCTKDWLGIDKLGITPKYKRQPGTFQFLINGETAFREVYNAIHAAESSILYVCWGFQPSMYFIRQGAESIEEINRQRKETGGYRWDGKKALPIGELLWQKAIRKIDVRILCWTNWLVQFFKVNLTGPFLGEYNTPGWALGINDYNKCTSPAQREYDNNWYRTRTGLFQPTVSRRLLGIPFDFRTRSFTFAERAQLSKQIFADKNISEEAMGNLTNLPTHHQKAILVDYDRPEDHVGFVMGHNTLDEYWDTNAHLLGDRGYHQPHTGPNGLLPRQDLSCMITGPICSALFDNFNTEWLKTEWLDKEGVRLPEPKVAFDDYPVQTSKIGPVQEEWLIDGRITRTQTHEVREKKEDKKKEPEKDIMYQHLHAIHHAYKCIYIENQYFRWPPLADKIKEQAALIAAAGAVPEKYDSLYLFVCTNSTDEAAKPGLYKTHEMLASLGRADTMPTIERGRRVDAVVEETRQNKQQLAQCREEQAALEKERAKLTKPRNKLKNDEDLLELDRLSIDGGERSENYWNTKDELDKRKAELEKKEAALEARAEEQAARQAEVDKKIAETDEERAVVLGEKPLQPTEIPGLRIHVCTLVPKDAKVMVQEVAIERTEKALQKTRAAINSIQTNAPLTANEVLAPYELRRQQLENDLEWLKSPAGRCWPETYIHSKLMIVDDAFMTLGSTNINTRSMEIDSELNISHYNPVISKKAREDLWGIHTNGKVGAGMGYKKAYETWAKIIKENKGLESAGKSPEAPLRGFLRVDPDETNSD